MHEPARGSNQSKLFAAAARRYARSGARSVAERREPVTHERCEWRRATVLRDTTFAALQKFPGSSGSKYIPAKRLLRIVRSHWGIENQLHWVLDVVFNEASHHGSNEQMIGAKEQVPHAG